MFGALEWARARTLAADGLSQREIARRFGINRRTVARMLASDEPPRDHRPPAGSQVDLFVPLLRRLLEEWPQIKAPRATEVLHEYGYAGSVDVVRRRLREPDRWRTLRRLKVCAYRFRLPRGLRKRFGPLATWRRANRSAARPGT